jgi:MFS family permease
VINGIYHPVRLSIMPSLLPRSDLPNAIAINSVLFNFARFLGPAVAGVLIVTIGLVGAFAVNALSYLAFIASLLMIDFSKIAPPRNNVSEKVGIIRQMKDGLLYTVAHPAIGPMLLLMFVIALTLRPVVEMMPAFAADVFQGKADVLAMLTSSVGIGAMIAGLTMAGRASDRLVVVILVAAAGMAVSVVLFVLSPYLPLALVFAACAGAAMIASGISMQILMQMSVTDDMRGRVLGLYSIIFFGGPAAGALIMGTLAELMGLRLPFFAGAALVLLATLALRNRHQQIQAAVGRVLDAPE